MKSSVPLKYIEEDNFIICLHLEEKLLVKELIIK